MVSEFYWLNPFFDEKESEPILRDVFTGWEDGQGIFPYLANVAVLPWADDENVDNSVLDLSYFGNHSGAKFCSPLVKLVINSDMEVPASARARIAKILVAKYLPNWRSLWATNVASYNPIHNYDVKEDRVLKTADSESQSVSEEQRHTGTDTVNYGGVETTEHGRTYDELVSKFGFNTSSSDPKPSDKRDSEEGGTTTVRQSGSDSDVRNLTDTLSNSKNTVGAGEEEEGIHRYGSVGVTIQKLIEEERKLWIWNYFDQIFNDLDRELALAFHDSCRV